jgi:hypothetical protein
MATTPAVATRVTRAKVQPWTTRAEWVRHVKRSGGRVTRMPEGRAGAGQLAAAYGGPGTRYPNMATVYDLAPTFTRIGDKVDSAVLASQVFDGERVDAQEKVVRELIELPGKALSAAGLPSWFIPALGAALVAYAINTVLPRRR